MRVDRAIVQQCLDCVAKVMPGNRDVVAWAALIQLASIDQFALVIEQIKVRRTNGLVSARHILRFVVTKRKHEALFSGHLGQAARRIVRISNGIVRGDCNNAKGLPNVVSTQPGKLALNMSYVWTMAADKHHKEPATAGERLQINGFAGNNIG